jgi:hypothetical protein
MKSVGGYVVIDKSPSYMLLLMVPEQVRDYHFCSYCQFYVLFVFGLPWCVFLLPNSSILIWKFFFDLKVSCLVLGSLIVSIQIPHENYYKSFVNKGLPL